MASERLTWSRSTRSVSAASRVASIRTGTTRAQPAAVSFLARYSGRTHALYTSQLARWFTWCEGNGLDPLVGIQRAHVELYIRHLSDSGLMDSSIVTMMHGGRETGAIRGRVRAEGPVPEQRLCRPALGARAVRQAGCHR